MRTSINIEDNILQQARREARALGLTLGAYVTAAIQRDLMTYRPKSRKPFRLVTVAGGRLRRGFSYSKLEHQANELDDLARTRPTVVKRRRARSSPARGQ